MLARAICQEPRILILDEPTSYLDMRYKIDILSSIRRLAAERNMAVLMSLHELDLALKVSDVIACVEGDHIGKTGTPEEVFSGDYIQKLYGVDAEWFDPRTGVVYLRGNKSRPKIFVIGGAGSGIPVYHALQRKNVPFAAGILMENDVEYQDACAAASRVVSVKPFFPVAEKEIAEARSWIETCETCICCAEAFGPYNEASRALREYAKTLGKLIPAEALHHLEGT